MWNKQKQMPSYLTKISTTPFIIIFLCILLFSILLFNDYHSNSTCFLYHMNILVCGWCHIRRADTAINNQTCYRKNTGNEDTYVYFKHTCRCCSLLSCVWGIPSAYSILHVFHPPRTYKVWPIIKHTPQQKKQKYNHCVSAEVYILFLSP